MEFVNYKVTVSRKDGTRATGVITHVDKASISLKDKKHSVDIASTHIADIKVIGLPDNLKKKKNENTPVYKSRSEDQELDKDVASIKDSEQFDFQANLAMFDKQRVFADFQRNDTVSAQDRLVGHNKVAKKEKYDNTEMVLESGRQDNWDLIGQGKYGSGSSSRVPTPTLPKEQGTRKSVRFLDGGNVVPVALPVQLLEIERLAGELGVSSELLIEAGSVNLAALISKQLLGASRLSKKNHNLPPLVLLLIGSGRCGARAFGAGRHLANHGARVLAYVINDDKDAALERQWRMFEAVGGKVLSTSVQQLKDVLTHELDTPVELIVDALQGYDDHLEDIFYQENDLSVVRELIAWVNEPKQAQKVVSLDIPSGIDGGSGTVSDVSLVVGARWVVSVGIPLTGLIHAYKNAHFDDVLHFLVDSGIPNKVYSTKGNLRKFDKFWHTADGYLRLDVGE